MSEVNSEKITHEQHSVPKESCLNEAASKDEENIKVAIRSPSSSSSSSSNPLLTNPTQDQTEKPLSKKQMKKRKRYEKLMGIKKRKKEQDKAVKAAKAKAEGRDLEKERQKQHEQFLCGEGRMKRERKWLERLKKIETSFKVCIDCSFEDLMTPKEIGSLSNQIRYCYAINKKSYHSVCLSVSSLKGQTHENLSRVEGFPDGWKTRAFEYSELGLEEMHTEKENLVYLTSDSENTLESLDNSKVYVIGGIVDRNRLKCTTIDKAKSLGIQTAKFPIDEHLKLCATKVLTINHVFEILLKFKEHNDWKKALLDVLPARKDIKSTDDAAKELIKQS
mmetsp:Transcript_15172/g.17661  ORF Transcript_15172/g.17661 Transcript_15172/m.17661 type:complete len:334 (-) Transcript_15172:426-1427(-)